MKELPESVNKVLEPGERVIHSVKKKISLEKPKWVIVTDRRIIYLDEKILGRYDISAVPYQKLEEVRIRLGLLSSEFIIVNEEGKNLNLSWMDKEEAKKTINAIKDALNAIAIEPVTVEVRKGLTHETWILRKPKELVSRVVAGGKPQGGPSVPKEDPLEKLKKLKELYDMGAITPEEYEEKRKKFLNEI